MEVKQGIKKSREKDLLYIFKCLYERKKISKYEYDKCIEKVREGDYVK